MEKDSDQTAEGVSARYYAERSLQYAKEGKYVEAGASMAMAAVLDPINEPQLRLMAGKLYLSAGNQPEHLSSAESNLMKAFRLGLQTSEVANLLAKIYDAMNRINDAKEWFQISVEKEDVTWLDLLDYANFLIDRLDMAFQAIHICERAMAYPQANQSPELYTLLGTAYAKIKNYKKAEEYFKKALSLEPNFLRSRYELASLLLEDSERYDEVETLIGDLHLSDPRFTLLKANMMARKRDFEETYRLGRYAISLIENNSRFRNLMSKARVITGTALLTMGKFIEAKQEFENGLLEDKDNEELILGLSSALEGVHDIEGATRVICEAIERGQCSEAILMEGARLKLGTSESLVWTAQALELDPILQGQVNRLVKKWEVLKQRLPEILDSIGFGGSRYVVRGTRIGHNSLMVTLHVKEIELFVKCYFEEQRSVDQIRYCTSLLEWLYEKGMPVPQPIKDENGGGIWYVPNAGIVTIMRRLEGHSLQKNKEGVRQLEYKQAREMGKLLAKLHSVTTFYPDELSDKPSGGMRAGLAFFLDEELYSAMMKTLNVGERFIEYIRLYARWLVKVCEEIHERFATFRDKLKRCIIHGDFGWHNCLWVNEHPTGIVDFDYACVDASIADIASAVFRIGFSWRRGFLTGDPRYQPDLVKGFIEGYQELLPLSDIEKEYFQDIAKAVRIPYYLSMIACNMIASDPVEGWYSDFHKTLKVLKFQLDYLDKYQPFKDFFNS